MVGELGWEGWGWVEVIGGCCADLKSKFFSGWGGMLSQIKL